MNSASLNVFVHLSQWKLLIAVNTGVVDVIFEDENKKCYECNQNSRH